MPNTNVQFETDEYIAEHSAKHCDEYKIQIAQSETADYVADYNANYDTKYDTSF